MFGGGPQPVERPIRILFYGTYPTQPIGYAKIGYNITNFLANQGAEVHYFGISHFPNTSIKRDLHPKIKYIDVVKEEAEAGHPEEYYGVNVIERELKRIKPDIFIIYNDLIVTCRIINALLNYRKEFGSKYKTFAYIDLVYDYEKPLYIEHMEKNVDHIFTFSDHWKKNLIDMGVPESKATVFYHGYDKTLKIIARDEARAALGIKPTDFVILNTNRNAYRKAWDITISAFLLFLKRNFMNPRIKLYINCHLETKEGYDILSLIKTECIRYNLDYAEVTNNHIIHYPGRIGYVEDNIINMMYCAADIGLNTCIGEGFGLCNMEQASLGIAQVVSGVGALKDIFEGRCITVNPVARLCASNHMDGHNGDMNICRVEDFAEAIDVYYKNPGRCLRDGIVIKRYITEKYDWENLLPKFWKDIHLFSQDIDRMVFPHELMPQAEQPQAEQPQAEQPQAEQPQAEQPLHELNDIEE